MPEVQLTEAGRKELEERLEYLKSVRRAEIAEEIKTARGFGDLSEKRRVRRRAQSSGGNGRRNSGNRSDAASCKNYTRNHGYLRRNYRRKEQLCKTYTIVGTAEADLAHGRISDESPVSSALLKSTQRANSGSSAA